MKLILASNNAKKLVELRALLPGIELIAQGQLGIPEAEEPHASFVENALAKARHASRLGGVPALADDSGLCVDALAGAPGVRSARFAQDHQAGEGDEANNRLLLQRLQGRAERDARFVCALVAVRHADDPEPLIAMGRWKLRVLEAALGEGGFGYDPIVQAVGFDGSVASLPAAVKNANSHRALAMQLMLGQLRADWGWA